MSKWNVKMSRLPHRGHKLFRWPLNSCHQIQHLQLLILSSFLFSWQRCPVSYLRLTLYLCSGSHLTWISEALFSQLFPSILYLTLTWLFPIIILTYLSFSYLEKIKHSPDFLPPYIYCSRNHCWLLKELPTFLSSNLFLNLLWPCLIGHKPSGKAVLKDTNRSQHPLNTYLTWFLCNIRPRWL